MISMNAFQAEPEELLEEEIKSVERVIRSGWYVLGKEVEQFEKYWAECCGVDYAYWRWQWNGCP